MNRSSQIRGGFSPPPLAARARAFARTHAPRTQVLELARRALNDVIAEPSKMLDASFDPFAPLVATVAPYAAFRQELADATAVAVDGKTRVSSISAVRGEIYNPTDQTNIDATEKTLEQIKAFAGGMLNTMMNGQAARYTEGGEYSTEMQTEEMLGAFEGTNRTTNPCESYFGTLKYYGDLFNCAAYNANACVAAKRDHIFGTSAKKHKKNNRSRARKVTVCSAMQRKRARDAADEESRLAELKPELIEVIMHDARGPGKRKYREDALAAAAAADAASLARREKKIAAAQEKQTKCYVKAQDALDVTPVNSDADVMGRTHVATLMQRVDAAMAEQPRPSGKRRVLVENIKRYTVGQGHAALEPKSFSSEVDATIGKKDSLENVSFLRSALSGVYMHIKTEKVALVNEPAVPELHRQVRLPTLGVPTFQRVSLEADELRSADELRAAADEFRSRPRAACTPRRAAAPARPDMPAIDDSLITSPQTRVDVAWEIEYRRRGGGALVDVFWCPGRIARVKTDSRGGWIYVEYDDGSSGWLLASRPSFWMGKKAGAWRFEQRPSAGEDDDADDEGEDDVTDASDGDGEMSGGWGDENDDEGT